MFVSDKLIYIMLQKTGSNYIAKLLSQTVGGKQINSCKIGKHGWLKNYDTEKHIVGSVRNPWDWYVSYWHFRRRVIDKNNNKFLIQRNWKKISSLLFNSMFNNDYSPFNRKNISLNDVWLHIKSEIRKPVGLYRDVLCGKPDKKKFKKFLYLIFDDERMRDFGEGYAESSIGSFSGFMTYRYFKIYEKDFFKEKFFKGIKNYNQLKKFDEENNILDFTIKTENLKRDLIEILNKTNHELSPEDINTIMCSKKTNTSSHLKTSYYYDEEAVELIRNKEKFIIEKYNYKSPLDCFH